MSSTKDTKPVAKTSKAAKPVVSQITESDFRRLKSSELRIQSWKWNQQKTRMSINDVKAFRSSLVRIDGLLKVQVSWASTLRADLAAGKLLITADMVGKTVADLEKLQPKPEVRDLTPTEARVVAVILFAHTIEDLTNSRNWCTRNLRSEYNVAAAEARARKAVDDVVRVRAAADKETKKRQALAKKLEEVRLRKSQLSKATTIKVVRAAKEDAK